MKSNSTPGFLPLKYFEWSIAVLAGLFLLTLLFWPSFAYTADSGNETRKCVPTPRDSLGPFYKPGAPERQKVGEGYVLKGLVRSAADCSTLSRVKIEFWLAGPDKQYDDAHRATLYSDADGAYRFESNFPPPYMSRPSHIHIKVSAPGHKELVTQHYPGEGKREAVFDLVLEPSGSAG